MRVEERVVVVVMTSQGTLFCPLDGTMLLVDGEPTDATMCFTCRTCPYKYPIHSQFGLRSKLQRKAVDDVMGGADAWKNVDQTEALCPKCGHDLAYFIELQTRSADEPSTFFYKCCKCKHEHRSG